MTIKSLELIHQLLEGHFKTTYDAYSAAEKNFARQRKEAPDGQRLVRPESLCRLNDQLRIASTALNELETETWT